MVRSASIAWLVLLASCTSAPARVSAGAASPTVSVAAPDGLTSVQPPAHAIEPPSAATKDAPTWATIYARHLAVGTAGGCARSAACHASQMGDAASAYGWLRQRGYIDGTQSALVRGNSCLRWFGGNMPPRGSEDPDAAADLIAWVAAGSREN